MCMNNQDNYLTRKSLLMRACDQSDYKSWEEFIDFYRNFIFYVLRKMSVNPNEIDDIYQRISMQLWKSLSKFQHGKGKFRNWLSVVIRNEVLNYFRTKKRVETVSENDIEISGQASDEPVIDKMIDEEWHNYILKNALDNLKEVFSGQAIEVFRLTLKGCSTQEISDETGIKPDSIKVLRSRVKGRCMQEIKRLQAEYENE